MLIKKEAKGWYGENWSEVPETGFGTGPNRFYLGCPSPHFVSHAPPVNPPPPLSMNLPNEQRNKIL